MSRQIYLYITSYFPRPEAPSSCTFVYNQAMAIKRARPDFDIVIINTNYDGDYIYRGMRVYGVRQFTAGRWLSPCWLNKINERRFLSALGRAGIELSEVFVAHGHLIGAATYLNFLKRMDASIKTLLQLHDADPLGMLLGGEGLFGFKKRRYFAYHRKVIARVDILVAISENVARVVREAPHQQVFNQYEPMRRAMRILRRFNPIERLPSVYVLHNGVDRRLFQRGARIEQRNGDVFVIGCVGVFRDLKGQDVLIDAVSSLQKSIPNLKVRFVRGGPTLEKCKEMAREKNVNAEFISEMQQSQLKDFYASLDLFVLPSYFEGLGCVFLEAWSCGVPFITCEGQGIDDYILPEDRRMWLCKQRNPEDLAQKILYYYKNRPQQRLAAETDIDVLIPKFLDAVESI